MKEKKVWASDLITKEDLIGEEIEEYFVLGELKKGANAMTSWRNSTLSDKTGKVKCVIWKEALTEEMLSMEGMIVSVRGLVTIYNNEPRLQVRSMEIPGEELNDRDYYESMDEQKEKELRERLRKIITKVQDPVLNCLLRSVYTEEFIIRFKVLPGGSRHHVYSGGLFAHVVETAELADVMCRQILSTQTSELVLNRDICVTGALLHDLGKCRGYLEQPGAKRTTASMLIGIETEGVRILDSYIESFVSSYPDQKEKWRKEYAPLLANIILSCHAVSNMPPRTIESMIVQRANQASADVDAFLLAAAQENEKELIYSKHLGYQVLTS